MVGRSGACGMLHSLEGKVLPFLQDGESCDEGFYQLTVPGTKSLYIPLEVSLGR